MRRQTSSIAAANSRSPSYRRLQAAIVCLALAGLVPAAHAADLKTTNKVLKKNMVAITKISWDAPGKPSKRYPEAIRRHSKLNPKLAAFADQILATANSADLPTQQKEALRRAGQALEAQAEKFRIAWEEHGLAFPPRIERAIQPLVLDTLDEVEQQLDEVEQQLAEVEQQLP